MERAEEIAVREMRDAFELDPPLEVNAGVGPGLALGQVAHASSRYRVSFSRVSCFS